MLAIAIGLAAWAVHSTAWAGDVTGTVSGVADPENVVVYIEHADGTFPPPAGGAVMDQRNQQFVPHVLPVLSGTVVHFPNSDTVRHNVFSPSKAKKFNLGIYPQGTTKDQVMDIPGAAVVSLLCAIHAQLAAFVVVLQNPYFVMPAADGSFAIHNVPSGSYRIVAWHEKQGDEELPKQAITLGANATVSLAFRTDHGRSGQ
jgi:plastocyanin